MAQEANFPAEPQVYGDVSDMLYVFPLSDVELLRTRNDVHATGEADNGNFITGIGAVDDAYSAPKA